MSVRLFLFLLSASATAAFGQYCESLTPTEAAEVVGSKAPGKPLSLGPHGCSFSFPGRTERLTISINQPGVVAREDYENLLRQVRAKKWLNRDENGMGYVGYSEKIPATPDLPSSKYGFTYQKGNKLIEVYVSGLPNPAIFDRLRPIALRVLNQVR